MYKGPAPVVASAASFGQWWTDNTYTNNTHTVGTLELGPVEGSTSLFRFSSAPHSVYGGFFPLESAAANWSTSAASAASRLPSISASACAAAA